MKRSGVQSEIAKEEGVHRSTVSRRRRKDSALKNEIESRENARNQEQRNDETRNKLNIQ